MGDIVRSVLVCVCVCVSLGGEHVSGREATRDGK